MFNQANKDETRISYYQMPGKKQCAHCFLSPKQGTRGKGVTAACSLTTHVSLLLSICNQRRPPALYQSLAWSIHRTTSSAIPPYKNLTSLLQFLHQTRQVQPSLNLSINMADDLSCKVNVSALSEQDDEQLPSPGPDSLKHLSDKKVEEGERVEEWETPQDKAKATKDLLTQLQGPFRFLSLQENDEPKQQGQDEHDLYLLPKPRDPLESFKERHPVSDKLYNFITCLADAVFKECEKSREARDMLGTELFLGLDEAAGKVFMYFGFLRYSEETVKFNFSVSVAG